MTDCVSFSLASGESTSSKSISGENNSTKSISREHTSSKNTSSKYTPPHLRKVVAILPSNQLSSEPPSNLDFDISKINDDRTQTSQPMSPIKRQLNNSFNETSSQNPTRQSNIPISKFSVTREHPQRKNIVKNFAVPRFAPPKDQFHSELTANITIWLYQNLKSLGDHRKYVEVECSLGWINKKTNIESVHAPEGFVLNVKPWPKFHNKISTETIKTIRSNSDRLIASRKNEFLGSSKVNLLDEFYTLPGLSNRVRKTIKNINEIEIVVKKPIDFLLFVLPNSVGVCKIKISLELPLSECTDNLNWERDLQKLNFTRSKARDNLNFQDFVTSFTQVGTDMTEVEVEMNQKTLLELFQKCKRKDSKRDEKAVKWLALENLVASSISAVNLLSENNVF